MQFRGDNLLFDCLLVHLLLFSCLNHMCCVLVGWLRADVMQFRGDRLMLCK